MPFFDQKQKRLIGGALCLGLLAVLVVLGSRVKSFGRPVELMSFQFALVSPLAVTVFSNSSSTTYPIHDPLHPFPASLRIAMQGIRVGTGSLILRTVSATSVTEIVPPDVTPAWLRNGADRRIAVFTTLNGDFQFSAAKIGEEKKPTPPSSLEKWNGTAWEQVLSDPTRLFRSVVAGAGEALAVSMDDGNARVRISGRWIDLGPRQPLFFLDESHLLLREGFHLKIWSLSTRIFEDLGALPPGDVSIHATISQ